VVQQMILFRNGHSLTARDLPLRFHSISEPIGEGTGGEVALMDMVSDLERKWILAKLKESEWNQEKAAKLLGITRKMLTNRIKKYRLDKFRKKSSLMGKENNSPR